jgi:hypothetical protein
MTDTRSFQKLAGVAGMLVTLFIAGNVVTLFAAVQNHTEAFSDAAVLLPMGAGAARWFHTSMVLDVLGYLFFIPVVLWCAMWIRAGGTGWGSLFTFCGLAYSLLGALGGVMVDAVLPRLMLDFPAASAAQQETLRLLARYFYLAVAHGIWNPLEVLMLSIWFLGLGRLLRAQQRALAILALVAGCIGLLDPLGWVIRSDVVLNIGGLGTVLLPIWCAWFAIDVLRRPLAPAAIAQAG